MYFYFNSYFYYFSCRNYTERLNKFIWATFVNHWDLLLRRCSERREKEVQKMNIQKTFRKTHIVQQTKHKASVTKKSVHVLYFGIQEFGCDPSLMKISYNLTKRITKTEKFEKCLKKYIINFKTKGYKLSKTFG